MNPSRTSTVELASALRSHWAGRELPPAFAKLYSQFTLLSADQLGLLHWREDEAYERMNDALRILEAGWIEKEEGLSTWHDSFRRAAELFEWISAPKLRPEELPTQLYSASLYQIAGYPARASGILSNPLSQSEDSNSVILTALLRADFPKLLSELSNFWRGSAFGNENLVFSWQESESLSSDLNRWLFHELVSSLGVLCSSMRWGDEERLSLALDRLKTNSKIFLHSNNIYSGLLSVLVYETVVSYVNSTLRNSLENIFEQVDSNGRISLERYLRQAYQYQRSLAWPSQVRGVERLVSKKSFALCTPTGSGKTSIAEIAILQSLFFKETDSHNDDNRSAPLAIYLVPSRALAAEVEERLSRVLKNLERPPVIIVTGLYGGTDWGPTDAWITASDRTILICTYEKAEALIRFLGPLFINRIRLVIIDEAHSVNFTDLVGDLQTGESRPLRLEALCMRLLSYIDETQGRAIALSAVASGNEQALARWVTGNKDASPETTDYRSTRQLIGRLECKPDGHFEIRYDLLDNSDLTFENEEKTETPFIIDPFPPFPSVKKLETGVEVRLRPYLIWAAMNFASADVYGLRHSVLISLTQNISTLAKYFLELLDDDWKDIQLPSFFAEPTEPHKKELWNQCLASCKDYFSESSYEYKLLSKGIVLHHGKMPGLMGRLLTRVIREKIVHVVIATSTLSEGVNLPFETILVPTLRRAQKYMSISEFRNLVGRAGRPGINTEGKSLVLLATSPLSSDGYKERNSIKNARHQYERLIGLMQDGSEGESNSPKSPLGELLRALWNSWKLISGSESSQEFYVWLEQTAPVEVSAEQLEQPNQKIAIELLDSVDGVILSAIVEIEQVLQQDLSPTELEEKLIRLWRRTYAYFSEEEEKLFGDYFIRRGKALLNIYPTAQHRRRLYCTSVQPRSGSLMLQSTPTVIEHLKTGMDYSLWDEKSKYEYIRKTVELISKIPKFSLPATRETNLSWDELLLWWLNGSYVTKRPSENKISKWFDYVAKNFSYRLNWGLGSVISLIINETNNGKLNEFHLDDWSKTGLPWVSMWIKELIIWGTLDPVAAYLLSQSMENTRTDAQNAASIYYKDNKDFESANSLLDPRNIRAWAGQSLKAKRATATKAPPNTISVTLLRDFTKRTNSVWRVLPVIEEKQKMVWFDAAGFALAESPIPEDWNKTYFENYDFQLNASQKIITWIPYL
jgi:hypothetical protein